MSAIHERYILCFSSMVFRLLIQGSVFIQRDYLRVNQMTTSINFDLFSIELCETKSFT